MRKIIQVSAVPASVLPAPSKIAGAPPNIQPWPPIVYALCDDGSLYFLPFGGRWERIPSLPISDPMPFVGEA